MSCVTRVIHAGTRSRRWCDVGMTREICAHMSAIVAYHSQVVEPTLTFEPCGIASCPSFAGKVTSQRPYSPLVIGVASLFHSSCDG